MTTDDERPAACIWRTRPLPTVPSDGDWAALSAPDRRHADGISHPAARTRFVIGRALLHAAVADLAPELGSDPLELEVAASGRLDVAGREDLRISISHTRGLAAAAVSRDGGVGIDVEPIGRDDLPPPAVWLTDAERRRLGGGSAQGRRRRLLRLWVAKEAAIKAGDRPRPVTRRTIEVDEEQRRVVGAGGSVRAEEIAVVGWFVVADRFLVALARTADPAVAGRTARTPITRTVGPAARPPLTRVLGA
jgi:phosphopantetheinyl transferase (holo-ACP synthase)